MVGLLLGWIPENTRGFMPPPSSHGRPFRESRPPVATAPVRPPELHSVRTARNQPKRLLHDPALVAEGQPVELLGREPLRFVDLVVVVGGIARDVPHEEVIDFLTVAVPPAAEEVRYGVERRD